MFFRPIRSGMTRWIIWPSVSSVFNSSPRALEQGAAAFGKLDALAKLEGVVIGDDDLGAIDVAEHVAGDQFAVFVVAVRVVGLEHAESVSDGQAGRHDEKAAGESACCRAGGRR